MSFLRGSVVACFFVVVGVIVLAQPAFVSAESPIVSDTFDSYTIGSLMGQGGWTSGAYVRPDSWLVIDDPICWSGKCIVSNGLYMEAARTLSTPLSSMHTEWRIYVASGASTGKVSVIAPLVSGNTFSITFVTSSDGFDVIDPIGTTLFTHESLDTWHRVSVDWYMSQNAACTMLMRLDDGATVTTQYTTRNFCILLSLDRSSARFNGIILHNELSSKTYVDNVVISDGPAVMPSVTLTGDATTTVEFGTPFTDPGATATDALDGDLTAHIRTTPATLDTTTLGTTTITYAVTNSRGLTATTTRDVVVVCTKDCYDNVMFLPGIEGSRLYAPGILGENKIWEPDSPLGNDVINLDMANSSMNDIIYAKDKGVIDSAYKGTFGYEGFNVYASFITRMNALVATKTIHDWEPIAYDWRLDYSDLLANGNETSDGKIYYRGAHAATSTPYIVMQLKRLAASSKTGKVTIIAHSNGGLLAKALLSHPEYAQYVDTLILVATPQLGAPQAIGGLLHGADLALPKEAFPLFLTDADARYLAQNTPMPYNLLPSATYFQHVFNPVVSFDSATLPGWAQTYGQLITSQNQLRLFMTDASRTKPARTDTVMPEIVNQDLYFNAIGTHAVLDNWTPPAGVHLVTIAGWGNDTVSGIAYKTIPQLSCAVPGDHICTLFSVTNTLTYMPQLAMDGDDTVPEVSAQWTNGAPATQYWVNLFALNASGGARYTHANIFEAPSVLSLLASLITNATGTSLPPYIETTHPTYTGAAPRLHFIVHSPVTLGFTDAAGHYTGAVASGSAAFAVPGVEYHRFGEVQWLTVPTSLAGHVTMHGTGSGSFALDIEEVSGNTTLATTTFAAIPCATATVATLVVAPNVSPAAMGALVVDTTGDGTHTVTYHARQGAVVLPDLTPPATTVSLAGTRGQNGWFVSGVRAILTATDAGTGVRQTFYSLDGNATTTGTAIAISTDGMHTLSYYSVDNAGNQEPATTTSIKIDTTPPEAIISANVPTRDLLVVGNDMLSSSTVTKLTPTTAIIVDQAGNATTLTFQKTFTGGLLTYVRLARIQYGASTPINLPSSFVYLWNPLVSPPTLLSQAVVADTAFGIEAVYAKAQNKTTIVVKNKGARIQTTTVTGLALIKLTTIKGTVGYSW